MYSAYTDTISPSILHMLPITERTVTMYLTSPGVFPAKAKHSPPRRRGTRFTSPSLRSGSGAGFAPPLPTKSPILRGPREGCQAPSAYRKLRRTSTHLLYIQATFLSIPNFFKMNFQRKDILKILIDTSDVKPRTTYTPQNGPHNPRHRSAAPNRATHLPTPTNVSGQAKLMLQRIRPRPARIWFLPDVSTRDAEADPRYEAPGQKSPPTPQEADFLFFVTFFSFVTAKEKKVN